MHFTKKRMNFSNRLVFWYLQNKRDLPWRTTLNPYHIWLSEIILQQTRVDQGMSYYLKFIDQYPTIANLAAASEEDVLKLWQGLGYYSRARNLHATAKKIHFEYHGIFPSDYDELLKLKGIGDYTASAIASICFDLPTAVVDGNVFRFLARYFNISTPINSTKGIKEFKQLAQELLDIEQPGTHNQAMMEFGARVCKPMAPDCDTCIFNTSCLARSKNKIKVLPVKLKKTKIVKKYFNYLVIETGNHSTFIHKRVEGIWKNLYEFPLINSENELQISELIEHPEFLDIVGDDKVSIQLFNDEQVVHKLSHQHLYTKFWIIKSKVVSPFSHPWNSIDKFPVPTLIHNFLKQYKNN